MERETGKSGTQFLNGKTAIVTGGTRGIGRAIAEALLSEGATVIISGRSRQSVDSAVEELGGSPRVYGRPCDVGSVSEVAEFFAFADTISPVLNVLVNNAGIGIFRPVGELSPDEWRQTIDTNLSGVFYCSREAIGRMRRSGGGYIVNISSLAGRNPLAGGSAYNASKFGLNGLSEATMLDHRRDGIRVTYVMPGSVDTEFGGHNASASWKIAPSDVADMVVAVLRMPERTTVSRVEIRPSVPPK